MSEFIKKLGEMMEVEFPEQLPDDVHLITTPENWTVEQMAEFQAYMDAICEHRGRPNRFLLFPAGCTDVTGLQRRVADLEETVAKLTGRK